MLSETGSWQCMPVIKSYLRCDHTAFMIWHYTTDLCLHHIIILIVYLVQWRTYLVFFWASLIPLYPSSLTPGLLSIEKTGQTAKCKNKQNKLCYKNVLGLVGPAKIHTYFLMVQIKHLGIKSLLPTCLWKLI